MDEVSGGSPYGATTVADDGNGGDRQPSANELAGARFQGRHVAEVAMAMVRGADRRSWRLLESNERLMGLGGAGPPTAHTAKPRIRSAIYSCSSSARVFFSHRQPHVRFGRD